MSIGVLDEFDNRQEFYTERRDAFRKCKRAMLELAQWKAQNNDYEYVILYVPSESLRSFPFCIHDPSKVSCLMTYHSFQ